MTQFGATFTRRVDGTSPFTSPARPVGRLFGSIGLAAFAVAPNTIVPSTASATANASAVDLREAGGMPRIQPGRPAARHDTPAGRLNAPSADSAPATTRIKRMSAQRGIANCNAIGSVSPSSVASVPHGTTAAGARTRLNGSV